jgi:ribosomal protein L32
MRENCTSGIAPGAPGNRRSYGGGTEEGSAMAHESCLKCGARKHQLVACPSCGFTKIRNAESTLSQSNTALGTSMEKISPSLSQGHIAKRPSLAKCSQCNAFVQEDRLVSHIQRVHVLRTPKKRSQQGIGGWTSQTNSSFRKCMVCGRPAIPGDNVCYTHSQ